MLPPPGRCDNMRLMREVRREETVLGFPGKPRGIARDDGTSLTPGPGPAPALRETALAASLLLKP